MKEVECQELSFQGLNQCHPDDKLSALITQQCHSKCSSYLSFLFFFTSMITLLAAYFLEAVCLQTKQNIVGSYVVVSN